MRKTEVRFRSSRSASVVPSASIGRSFFFAPALALIILTLALLPACSVNVKKDGDGRNGDKQVDIKSIFGGIHVSKGADVSDVGLPVYPGARPKQKDAGDDDDKSANVNISGFGFGLKVVALQYQSDDPPSRVMDFYRDQLKKYGDILVCRSSTHFDVNLRFDDKEGKAPRELKCNGDTGNNVEMKVGTKENQHIVAVEPDGKGSSFSLVYVRTHGNDADI